MLNQADENLLKDKFSQFDLSKNDLETIIKNASYLKCQKGQILYPNGANCYGFVIVKYGKIRAFVQDLGKEITIFNLNPGDECVLCMPCINQNLQFEINLEVKENLEMILIDSKIFSQIKQKYQKLTNYLLNLISKRFAMSMNIMQTALFTPLSKRILDFIYKNAKNGVLKTTHETIASELGTAREVVSRILKDMEKNGEIYLTRGKITINSDFKLS